MTASLYQDGSSPGAIFFFSSPAIGFRSPFPLHEVVEILLGADPAAQPDDVRRNGGRVELDEEPAPLPQESRPAQQVVPLERGGGAQPELLEGEFHPAGLRVAGVEIDHHEN